MTACLSTADPYEAVRTDIDRSVPNVNVKRVCPAGRFQKPIRVCTAARQLIYVGLDA